ncbi:hypothetical protein HPP92_022003 [Vanilla planifolia]|uniref:Uncharacterized protein n=1 Tax=Vanilla planifolia TaxID=51239 RepID=A0A835UF84_VANPL|nr:hypothetical protein HPP92_022003 [Vanilla planifolia]
MSPSKSLLTRCGGPEFSSQTTHGLQLHSSSDSLEPILSHRGLRSNSLYLLLTMDCCWLSEPNRGRAHLASIINTSIPATIKNRREKEAFHGSFPCFVGDLHLCFRVLGNGQAARSARCTIVGSVAGGGPNTAT